MGKKCFEIYFSWSFVFVAGNVDCAGAFFVKLYRVLGFGIRVSFNSLESEKVFCLKVF